MTSTDTYPDVHPLHSLNWWEWLKAVYPQYVTARFADHHAGFWEWFWALEKGVRPDPLAFLVGRGGAKSTSLELGITQSGAFGTRSYWLYVCGVQDRADDHVASIASMLESPRVEALYPDLADRKLGKHGNSRGWRRNRLWTRSGLIVDAIGLDTAARGVKLEEQRPDGLALDEIDGRHDSPATTRKKIEALTEGIIPAGSPDVATVFVQNLIHRDSVAAQLADGRAEFLRRRKVIGPIPALRDFRVDDTGQVHGTPTWEGQDLDTCRAQVDDWGLRAFRREAQHEVAEAEGALWSRGQVGAMRRVGFTPEGPLVEVPEHWKKGAVAVDPSGGDGPDNDECGIVSGVRGYDDKGYVLADDSGRLAPEAWGRLAVIRAIEQGHMRIVAEQNYGYKMVEATVSAAKQQLAQEGGDYGARAMMVQVVLVNATVGKRQRAEPVASLSGEPDDEKSWTRGRIHLAGDFPQMEDELTGWVPDVTKTSPNRLDSFVWLMTDLFPDLLGASIPRTGTRAARRRHGSIGG